MQMQIPLKPVTLREVLTLCVPRFCLVDIESSAQDVEIMELEPRMQTEGGKNLYRGLPGVVDTLGGTDENNFENQYYDYTLTETKSGFDNYPDIRPCKIDHAVVPVGRVPLASYETTPDRHELAESDLDEESWESLLGRPCQQEVSSYYARQDRPQAGSYGEFQFGAGEDDTAPEVPSTSRMEQLMVDRTRGQVRCSPRSDLASPSILKKVFDYGVGDISPRSEKRVNFHEDPMYVEPVAHRSRRNLLPPTSSAKAACSKVDDKTVCDTGVGIQWHLMPGAH